MAVNEAKQTPGPWAQGVTLRTRQTERWSEEELRRNEEFERRRVFANFSGMDEGRSRVLVATVERAEDAPLVAAAPELLEELCAMVLEHDAGGVTLATAKAARAAIAKATGSAA